MRNITGMSPLCFCTGLPLREPNCFPAGMESLKSETESAYAGKQFANSLFHEVSPGVPGQCSLPAKEGRKPLRLISCMISGKRPARKMGGKKRRSPGRGEAARCGSGVAGRWRGPVVYRRGSSCTRFATLAPLRPHNLRRNVTPHRRLGPLGARLCLLMGQMWPLGPLGLLGVPRYMRSRAVVFPVRSAQAALSPRKSTYLTPWSERSGDFRRGLRPSVWLKISKTLARLCSSVWLAPLRGQKKKRHHPQGWRREGGKLPPVMRAAVQAARASGQTRAEWERRIKPG